MATIATTDRVDRDQLLDFVRPRHQMTLMTLRRDGRPQVSPVTGGVDAEGRLVISTYPERAKAANLRRDPRATVLVHSDEWNGPYVQVDGTAEVLDMPSTRPRTRWWSTSAASPGSTPTGRSTARRCAGRASR